MTFALPRSRVAPLLVYLLVRSRILCVPLDISEIFTLFCNVLQCWVTLDLLRHGLWDDTL